MVFPNQAKAATNMVENAMSKDLRNAVATNLGASDAAKYLKANSDYANVYNKVLNKNIANKLNKASSEASPELINTVVLSRKPSDVKRIWSALDDKGKDAMRAAYVSKIAEKAVTLQPSSSLKLISLNLSQAVKFTTLFFLEST